MRHRRQGAYPVQWPGWGKFTCCEGCAILTAMVFFYSLGSVFSILLIVIIGYVLGHLNWFPPASRKTLPKLVTNVALPPFMACTIISYFPRDDLAQLAFGAALPFLCMALLFSGAWLLAKAIRMSPSHLGLFCTCISNPNTIFIGIPVNLALFGEQSLPYVLLYYLASTCFFWTVGNYFIARDKRASAETAAKAQSGWQRFLPPPLLGSLTGMLVLVTELPVPDFIFSAARLTGQMATPLALVYVGVVLQGIGLRNLCISRDLALAVIGRLGVSPLLFYCVLLLYPLPELMGHVFIIQSSLPTIVQVAILSGYYGTDPDFGSMAMSLTTLGSVLTVPFYMALLA